MGRLNHWELLREGEYVEVRAEAIERGEPVPAHVEQFDMRKTPCWREWLRKNPDLLKEHPLFLKDLLPGEDPAH